MKKRIILSLSALLFLVACNSDTDRISNPIRSYDDIHGRKIVTLTGSTQDIYLSEVVKDCEVVRVESMADMYIALSQNKADALLTSSITWIQEHLEYPDMVCITDTISPLPIGVAFNKNEVELREQFNLFVKEYLKSDTYRQSYEEWAYPDSEREMPIFTDEECPNGTIVVAVAPIVNPFAFIKNGKVSGIEMETIARFGKSLGKRVVFQDMPFSAVIQTLASGKAQMAADLICITEERSQNVDFSDPWTYEGMALIVNPEQTEATSSGTFIDSIKKSIYNNFINENRYELILSGLWMTVLISIFSAIFGTMLGILLCIGMKSRFRIFSKSCTLYVDFMRCMPQVVFLMIMFYIVFGKTQMSGASVAIVALAMCFGAYTSIIFKSVLEGIDKGQTEAGLAMGFSRFKTALYFIIPQVIQRSIPIYKNEFIGLVKATSIVGYITVFDLTRAGDVIRSRTYEAFFPLIVVTIIYFIIIWVLSLTLKYVQIKTQPKRKKYYN